MKLSLAAVCTFALCAFAALEGLDADCIERALSSNGYRYFLSLVNGARTITSMTVIQKYSRSACTYKHSFGFLGVLAWVHRGCRAKFRICFIPGVSRTVTCSSFNYKYATCPTRLAYVYGVQPITHHSKSPCILNFSYGRRGNRIWVDKGCRATFRVTK